MRSADWQSAVKQVDNLRYDCASCGGRLTREVGSVTLSTHGEASVRARVGRVTWEESEHWRFRNGCRTVRSRDGAC
jgi:hypothetical protein